MAGAAGVTTITVLVLWPTPGALIVRAFFEYGRRKTAESLAKHRIADVSVTTESYRPDEADATIDIYRSASAPQ